MRILFWVPYPTEGQSNRFRVEQYLPHLKGAGIKYSLRPFWRSSAFRILYLRRHRLSKTYYFILGTLSRITDLLMISRYDIVFIHREAYPIGGAFFESILSILKKPVVFDFDDAVFLPTSSGSNSFTDRFKKPGKTARIIKMSSHVIAGNRYLADYALRYNKQVSVIPTPIDARKFYQKEKKENGKLVVGWIGSATTLSFLNGIKNVFSETVKTFPDVTFKIVGGKYSVNGLANVVSKPWSLQEELEDLMSFDIGIMPMPDNQWTRGKCGFKAILYMGTGIPCVCSPVGTNNEIVTDGVNGFLASTEHEWIEKLSLLIKDFELRKRIGRAGRETVENKYSTKANASKFLEVLQTAYERKYAHRKKRIENNEKV